MAVDTYFVLISNLESSQKPSSNIFLFFCLSKPYLSLVGYVTLSSCLTSIAFASMVQSFEKKKKKSKLSILVVGCVHVFCHMVSS